MKIFGSFLLASAATASEHDMMDLKILEALAVDPTEPQTTGPSHTTHQPEHTTHQPDHTTHQPDHTTQPEHAFHNEVDVEDHHEDEHKDKDHGTDHEKTDEKPNPPKPCHSCGCNASEMAEWKASMMAWRKDHNG